MIISNANLDVNFVENDILFLYLHAVTERAKHGIYFTMWLNNWMHGNSRQTHQKFIPRRLYSHMYLRLLRISHTEHKPVTLPWIFPGAPLIFNGAPRIIQNNLSGVPAHYVYTRTFRLHTSHPLSIQIPSDPQDRYQLHIDLTWKYWVDV